MMDSTANTISYFHRTNNPCQEKKEDKSTLFCKNCFKTDVSVITDKYGSWCFACWEELMLTIQEFNRWDDSEYVKNIEKTISNN